MKDDAIAFIDIYCVFLFNLPDRGRRMEWGRKEGDREMGAWVFLEAKTKRKIFAETNMLVSETY